MDLTDENLNLMLIICASLSSAGSYKLDLSDQDVHVFLEEDGTEVDDNDCFLAFGQGTVFIVGSKWEAETTAVEFSDKDRIQHTFPGTVSTEGNYIFKQTVFPRIIASGQYSRLCFSRRRLLGRGYHSQ